MRLAAAALFFSFTLVAAPAHAQLTLQRPDDGINAPAPAADPMLDEPFVLRPQSSKAPIKPKAAASSAGPAKSAAPAASAKSSSAPVKSSAAATVKPAGAPVKSSALSLAKPAGVAPKSSAPVSSALASSKPGAGAVKSSAPKSSALAAGAAPGAPKAAAALAKPASGAPAIAVSYRQCADSYFAGASLLRADPSAVDTLLQRAQLAGERQLKADPSADQLRLAQAIKMSGTARAAEIRALDEDAGPKAAQALFKTIRQCDAKMNLPITAPLALARGGPAEAAPVVRENAP